MGEILGDGWGDVPAGAVLGVGLAAWLIALSVCDVRSRRLPDVLTLPGAAAVLAVAALWGRGPAALAGGVALAGCYLLVHLVSPRAMGAGDVKLALGIGALTGAFGPPAWLLCALGASLCTVAVGVARRRGGAVPHGPSMCLAAAAAVTAALLGALA